MFTMLLWATDGSAAADAALGHALALLSPDGRLVAFHCDQRIAGGRANGEPVLADEVDRRDKITAQVEQLKLDGIDAELIVDVTDHTAADDIAELADELDADAIVCGSRGLGAIKGVLLGSVTQRLLHIAPCPVFVVPEHVLKRHPVST